MAVELGRYGSFSSVNDREIEILEVAGNAQTGVSCGYNFSGNWANKLGKIKISLNNNTIYQMNTAGPGLTDVGIFLAAYGMPPSILNSSPSSLTLSHDSTSLFGTFSIAFNGTTDLTTKTPFQVSAYPEYPNKIMPYSVDIYRQQISLIVPEDHHQYLEGNLYNRWAESLNLNRYDSASTSFIIDGPTGSVVELQNQGDLTSYSENASSQYIIPVSQDSVLRVIPTRCSQYGLYDNDTVYYYNYGANVDFFNDEIYLVNKKLKIKNLTASNPRTLSWELDNLYKDIPYNGVFSIYRNNVLIGTTSNTKYQVSEKLWNGQKALYTIRFSNITSKITKDPELYITGKYNNTFYKLPTSIITYFYNYSEEVSDKNSIYAGTLLSPSINIEKGIDSIKYIFKNSNTVTVKYYIKFFQQGVSNALFDGYINNNIFDTAENNISLLPDVDYYCTVRCVTSEPIDSESSVTKSENVQLKRLDSPQIITTSENIRTSVDGFTLSWKNVENAASYEYKIDSSPWINVGTNTNITRTGLLKGDHIFYIRAVYNNTTFNSLSSAINGDFSKLETPKNLTRNDIETSYIGENPEIKFTWNSVPFVSIVLPNQATYYELRDTFTHNVNGEEITEYITYSNITTLEKEILGDIEHGNDIGSHKFQIRTIYVQNSEYDSDWSEILPGNSYSISYIDNPTGFTFDHSTITGKTLSDSSWNISKNANRYHLRIISGTTSLDSVYTDKLEYDISKFNIYNDGVYTIKLTGMNTNHYYWRESDQESAPTLDYTVTKLSTPENIEWNSDTNTLSWSAVTGATHYMIYTYNKGVESLLARVNAPTTSYINAFGAGTYDINVYACYEYIYNNNDISSRLVPKYLKSSPANIKIGTIIPPTDLGIRYGNKQATLYWSYPVNDQGEITINGYKITLYKNVNNEYVEEINLENTDINTSYLFNYETPIKIVPGTEYKYEIRSFQFITISGELTKIYSSPVTTSSWKFTVTQLEKPEIKWITGKSQIYWTSVLNGNLYQLFINGIFKQNYTDVPTSLNPISLPSIPGVDITTTNSYIPQVHVINTSNQFLYKEATSENTEFFNVYTLSSPTVLYDSTTSTITWTENNSYSIAYQYKVHIDGAYTIGEQKYEVHTVETTRNTSYTFDLNPGSYLVWVSVVKLNADNDENPLYLESDEPPISDKISFGILPAPQLSLTENVISWNTIEGAEYYEIYDGNNLIQALSEDSTSYALYSNTEKVFNITIWARNSSTTVDDTNAKSSITYQVFKLSTPVITIDSNNVIHWTSVGSDEINTTISYTIYVNGAEYGETSSNYYDVSKAYSIGQNAIYIKATSTLINQLDSDYSNTIIFSYRNTENYVINIEGVSYPINISSLSISKAKNDTLDSASVALRINKISKRFDTKTPVKILIYTDLDDNDSSTKNPIASYDFILADDNVKEVYINGETCYEHNLVLQELTAELQTIFMPDFTITQKTEHVRFIGERLLPEYSHELRRNAVYDADMNTNTGILTQWPEGNNSDVSAPFYEDFWAFNGVGRFMVIEPFGKGPQSEPILNLYTPGTYMELPNEPDEAFNYSIYQLRAIQKNSRSPECNYSIESNIGGRESVSVTRRWYIRKHGTDTMTEIRNTSNNLNQQYLIPLNTEDGYYDIILKIDSPTIYLYNPRTKKNIPRTIKLMYTRNDDGKYKGEDYEVVWKNIQISSDGENPVNNEGKTIKDAIRKALDIIQPIIVRKGIHEERKYLLWDETNSNISGKYNASVLDDLTNVQCPKIDFTNLKNLYEVLLELGRSFNGIPRLILNKDGDKVITYDVQGVTCLGNTLFKPRDIVYNRESSDIANSPTSFISKLSNVVSDKRYIRYPAGNIWTTARGLSESDAYITRETMSIKLPYSIYAIKSVKVKNCIFDNPSQEVDITAYVRESSIYNLLENNIKGKALALKYTQYGNSIDCLGTLVSSTMEQEIYGLAKTDYIIEKIIGDKLNLLNDDKSWKNNAKSKIKDCKEYLYKIEYYTLSDTTITTELSNKAGSKYESQKVLNQDGTVISDGKFGDGAEIQLKRLGNETIQGTYKLSSVLLLPDIGQMIEYEGFNYYADIVRYQFFNNYIEATVQFSRNTSSINPRVAVDSEYRLYRIYSDNYVIRDININNYCYLSTQAYSQLLDQDNITDMTTINSKIKSAFTLIDGKIKKSLYPENFYLTPMSEYNVVQKRLRYSGDRVEDTSSVLTADIKTLKNSILFTATLQDNYSSGQMASTIDKSETVGNVTVKYFGQKDVPYTDENGECNYLGIQLCTPTQQQLTITDGFFTDIDGKLLKSVDISKSLPACRTILNTDLSNKFYKNIFYLNKDNRERLRINYQIHFMTYDKKLTIHKGLSSRVLRDYYDERNKPAQYYLFKGDISDLVYLPVNSDNQLCGNIDSTFVDSVRFKLNSIAVSPKNDYDGYVAIWPDTNEIIFSYRTQIRKAQPFLIPNIYFNFSNEKIQYQDK